MNVLSREVEQLIQQKDIRAAINECLRTGEPQPLNDGRWLRRGGEK